MLWMILLILMIFIVLTRRVVRVERILPALTPHHLIRQRIHWLILGLSVSFMFSYFNMMPAQARAAEALDVVPSTGQYLAANFLWPNISTQETGMVAPPIFQESLSTASVSRLTSPETMQRDHEAGNDSLSLFIRHRQQDSLGRWFSFAINPIQVNPVYLC